MTTLLIIILVLVVLVAFLYNNLVSLRVRTEEAWSDIDIQLKRRYDLIPNLVETVKGYTEHEKETLREVLEARSKASTLKVDVSNPDQMAEFSQIQTGLSGALQKLFALAEAYPDLKANTNFLELQRELTDTENKIQAARRFYNGTVKELNTRIQTFPSNILASFFSFKNKEFFEVTETEKEPIKVSFK